VVDSGLAVWVWVRQLIGVKGDSVKVRSAFKIVKIIKGVDLEENASQFCRSERDRQSAQRIANFHGHVEHDLEKFSFQIPLFRSCNFFFEFLIEPAILTSDCVHECTWSGRQFLTPEK
jgi:hypothetical protein